MDGKWETHPSFGQPKVKLLKKSFFQKRVNDNANFSRMKNHVIGYSFSDTGRARAYFLNVLSSNQ